MFQNLQKPSSKRKLQRYILLVRGSRIGFHSGTAVSISYGNVCGGVVCMEFI